MEVVVLHVMGHLMERQLDPSAGYLLQKDLERRGIKVHCKAQTKAILGQNRVEAVLLEDGTVYPRRHRGDGRRHPARDPHRHRRPPRGRPRHRRRRRDAHLRPGHPRDRRMRRARRRASTASSRRSTTRRRSWRRTLLGEEAAFAPVELSTKLKVTGCDLFSAGDFADAPDREEIVFRDAARGVYKRLVLKDNVDHRRGDVRRHRRRRLVPLEDQGAGGHQRRAATR